MDRGAWRATVCGGHKESDTAEPLTSGRNKLTIWMALKKIKIKFQSLFAETSKYLRPDHFLVH